MTEEEYIRVTNRAKISGALHLVNDCLPGEVYGTDEESLGLLIRHLSETEQALFDSYKIEATIERAETNRAKISGALHLVNDCLPGEVYGTDEESLGLLIRHLSETEQALFDSYKIEATDAKSS